MGGKGFANPLLCFGQSLMASKTRRKQSLTAVLFAVLALGALPAAAEQSGREASAQQVRKPVASSDFLKDSAIYYGSIWGFRFFYVRNKNERIFDTSLSRWWDNISQAPVKDDGDEFFTNYVVHPFAGYVSYLYYREMGYGFWGSALGSALQSSLFEYTVEGLVETPSLTDLLSTPGFGVVFGVVAENLSNTLIEVNNPATTFLAHLVNPMRNFVKDGRVALINPIQGIFEYTQSFDISHVPWKNSSIEHNSPHSFYSAFPNGYAGAHLEVADTKGGSGQIILYDLRFELPTADYGKSLYIIFNQSGVNNLPDRNPRDGYELSNFRLGGKIVVAETPSYKVSLGFESHLPTIYKDNVKRLREITSLYRRDLPVYLTDSYALTPFIGGMANIGALSLETVAGFTFVGKASGFEGDKSEKILKYGAALGLSLPVNVAAKVSVEITGNRFLSLKNGRKNNLYFTSGIRFGKFVSPSLALQIPVLGDDSKSLSKSVIAGIQIRF